METWPLRFWNTIVLSRPFASSLDRGCFPGWMAVVLDLVFAFRQVPYYECGDICEIELVPRRRAGEVRAFLK